MNHLAHAWLTPDDESELLAGNVLGDYFLAGQLPSLRSGIRRGFDLHQRIDRFSDKHPAFHEARKWTSPGRRRYAPVILDIFFDLFLAETWTAACGLSLAIWSPISEKSPIAGFDQYIL